MSRSTHEVHLAIYDLSNGMARSLSAQFLGPQHAIDVLPHTALVVFGKEYFFGRGIEWCHPQEFRMTRGIHPIEIQLLGHTTRTATEFEEWCRLQAQNGRFGVESYDLLSRNCNNFSHDAALEGLQLGRGVPQWILEVPQKFLSSPMGMMVRPILEQMQITNSAPTNIGPGGSGVGGNRGMGLPNSFDSGNSSSSVPLATPPSPAAAVANPWANIPSSSPPSSSKAKAKEASPSPNTEKNTPLLNKQTGPLLSTDTKVVSACVSRLIPDENDKKRDALMKLAETNATWTKADITSVHQQLMSFIETGSGVSFALMLLRLAVLRQPTSGEAISDKSTGLLVDMLLEGKEHLTKSATTKSMAWCVLSNAIGSKNPPSWLGDLSESANEEYLRLIDLALNDGNPISDASSSSSNISLRQSAIAFLYNVSRHLAQGEGKKASQGGENDELSETTMAILIGCLENLNEEKDAVSLTRRYMCVGQLLKAKRFGKTAIGLVRDLGLFDGVCNNCENGSDLNGLAKEVAKLLDT
ncbi:hypothetical protein ACHAXS_011883 [Conticribra weissflogii]